MPELLPDIFFEQAKDITATPQIIISKFVLVSMLEDFIGDYFAIFSVRIFNGARDGKLLDGLSR